jgi:hypothetical protein
MINAGNRHPHAPGWLDRGHQGSLASAQWEHGAGHATGHEVLTLSAAESAAAIADPGPRGNTRPSGPPDGAARALASSSPGIAPAEFSRVLPRRGQQELQQRFRDDAPWKLQARPRRVHGILLATLWHAD